MAIEKNELRHLVPNQNKEENGVLPVSVHSDGNGTRRNSCLEKTTTQPRKGKRILWVEEEKQAYKGER